MSTANATPERTEKGQYAAGNKGGPGNPFARQVAALRKALLDAVTPEDLAEVTKALLAKAKAGDVPAARVLLGYLLGKPIPTVDPDRLDVHERDCFKEQATVVRDMDLAATVEPAMVLNVIRGVRPGYTEAMGGKMRDMFLNPEKYRPQPEPEEPEDPEAEARFEAECAEWDRIEQELTVRTPNGLIRPSVEEITAVFEQRQRSANGSIPPLPGDVSGVSVVDRPLPNGSIPPHQRNGKVPAR